MVNILYPGPTDSYLEKDISCGNRNVRGRVE